MTKKIFIGLMLIFILSCSNDDVNDSILQESGNIWLSGGLAFCAEQIHLDNGDTLIVDSEEILSFTSGDRVSVKYKKNRCK